MKRTKDFALLDYLVILFSILLIAGCGGSGGTVGGGSTDTGAIAARLNWEANGVVVRTVPAGVVTITITVSGADMSDVLKDFASSAGQGTVDYIPAGTGRTITARGLDAGGRVIAQGSVGNISIVAGQTTDAGTIILSSVSPTVTGYWAAKGIPAGMTTPSRSTETYIHLFESGGNVTATEPCRNRTSVIGGTISGTTISFRDGDKTFTGTVSATTISGAYSSPSESGTWTATRLTGPPTDKQCVASTAEAWCVYFPSNNQFWIESNFHDLNAVVASATLTGYKIDTPIPYAYNLYPNRPKEWWTNPNVYVSTGTPPPFPLHYTATIVFKDGTTQVISGDVLKWDYAQ